MDIHKPKPFHNWREFLKEYGIIVLGVLTALGGEQAVEAVHHHYEATELREALDQELAWDLAREKEVADLEPCVQQRMKEVDRWAEALASGHRLKSDGLFSSPKGLINRFAVWHSVAGTTLDLIPLDKRVAYALFYDHAEANDGYRIQASAAWGNLSEFSQAHALSPKQRLRVLHYTAQIRGLYHTMAGNYVIAKSALAPPLGITIDEAPLQDRLGRQTKIVHDQFCKPLLAS